MQVSEIKEKIKNTTSANEALDRDALLEAILRVDSDTDINVASHCVGDRSIALAEERRVDTVVPRPESGHRDREQKVVDDDTAATTVGRWTGAPLDRDKRAENIHRLDRRLAAVVGKIEQHVERFALAKHLRRRPHVVEFDVPSMNRRWRREQHCAGEDQPPGQDQRTSPCVERRTPPTRKAPLPQDSARARIHDRLTHALDSTKKASPGIPSVQ